MFRLLVFVIFSLIALSGLSSYHSYRYQEEKPKIRASVFRHGCFTWHANDRIQTRENWVLEYLAAANDTSYCHSGPKDELFGIKHELCQECKNRKSFWAHVRLIKREPRESHGKTICIAEKRFVRRYRCNLIKESKLTDEDYENCRFAEKVVYDVNNEAGYLCAVISPSTAQIKQIGDVGRYHYA